MPGRKLGALVAGVAALAASEAAADPGRVIIEGQLEWSAPEGWTRVDREPAGPQLPIRGPVRVFGPPEACGNVDTHVAFAELQAHVEFPERGLDDLRATMAELLGDAGAIERAEVTYPGTRVNLELELTFRSAGGVPVRQLLAVFPGPERTYTAAYSAAASCFPTLRDSIRASVDSFRNRGGGPGQQRTQPRTSVFDTVLRVALGAGLVAVLLLVWRRFRR